MIIYAIAIFLIFILAYICKEEKRKKYFCIFSGIILWGLLAMRNISMGLTDTEKVYLPFFNMIIGMDVSSIILYKFMSDKGFYLVMKVISIFTNNYQVCIAILAIPFVGLIMYGTYKYSKKPLMTVVMFIALYYAYGFFLLRQVIAIGIVFVSIRYIKEHKFKNFLFTILIASTFHNTALIFMIAYPICNNIKFGYKNYIAILISYITGEYIFRMIIKILEYIPFFSRYLYSINNNYYTMNSDFSIFGLMITVLILGVSHIYYKEAKKEDKKIDILFNLSTLGSIIYCLTPVITEFYRVALYFSIFNILLLPNTIYYHKDKKSAYFIYTMFLIIFIGYFFTRTINNTNINPYIFMN